MTAYAIMVEELTGKPVDDIVALVTFREWSFSIVCCKSNRLC